LEVSSYTVLEVGRTVFNSKLYQYISSRESINMLHTHDVLALYAVWFVLAFGLCIYLFKKNS